jgi:hypothetical protein
MRGAPPNALPGSTALQTTASRRAPIIDFAIREFIAVSSVAYFGIPNWETSTH